MKARTGLILAALVAAMPGCQSDSTQPWRLLELGTAPLTSAWERGECVAAFAEGKPWPGFIFPNDSSTQARIARRDAMTLPPILCGDKMRLHPKDLPLGWVQRFQWDTADSITVSWRCLDLPDLAALGEKIVRTSAHPEQDENLWVGALRQMDPPEFTAPERRFEWNEKVRLAISCQRPDGSALGDTVRLDFGFGETGQVIKAITPGLEKAGPGAFWTVWSPSSSAFGSQAQPELALAAHTPLKFSISVE